MQFVNPWFLFGLAAIAVPIIIHLFNFRRFKKVYFTNVRFLEELQQKTQKQSQIRHLIVLLLRILGIASLVIAFAQPYIPSAQSNIRRESRHAVSVFVDNSFSMGLQATAGSLLEESLEKARELAMAYNPTDVFQLLTHDFEGKHQRFVSREEFLEMLNDVAISPSSRKFSEIYRRQTDLHHEHNYRSKIIAVISDFQKNMMDLDKIPADTAYHVFLIPVEPVSNNNLYIDTAWLEAPAYRIGQLAKMQVRIKNSGNEDYEKIPVRILINGQQRAVTSFDIRAGKEVNLVLPFSIMEKGLHFGQIEITDYPVTFDDTLFFIFEVLDVIPILAVNAAEENPFLNALYLNDSAFVLHNLPENKLDYSSFNQYNLIILNGLNTISSGLAVELQRFTENGGNLAIFPGENADLNSYRQFFQSLGTSYLSEKVSEETKISKVNNLSALYDDVFESIQENIDLPLVKSHYPIRQQPNSLMEIQLGMLNGNIFLGSEPAGRGMLYLFAVPLNDAWSTFGRHAIFVPTMYKIALLSQGKSRLYYFSGENEKIVLRNALLQGDQVYRIKSLTKEFEFIPEIRSAFSQIELFTQHQVREAGHYQVLYNNEPVTAVAFNYPRRESDLQSFNRSELVNLINQRGLNNFSVIKPSERSLTDVIAEMTAGTRLAWIFIVFALLFLLAEALILRFLK